jgi:thioesterase domain-containing protein
MIPAAFVSVDSFPLTPSGKLDRKALPPPDVAVQDTDAALIEPRTPTEKVLARIWCEMLDLKQVGVRDNFFDLGGNSRLVVLIIGEINKTLQARLNVPEFFQNPTIEGLTRILEQKGYVQPELQIVRPEPQVLQLQPGHTGLPLYFIGAGAIEYQLARLIGEDHAIFGTDAPLPVEWITAIAAADETALFTVEQLGELHGDALRAHAGSSPCVVAGYSVSAKIAFEAARVLQRAGGNVALVLLLDGRATDWNGFTRGAASESWRWIWRDAATKTANDPPNIDRLSARLRNSWRLLRWLLARIPPIVKSRLSPPSTFLSGFLDETGMPIDANTIMRFSRIAAKSWHPRPIDTSAVLFRAKIPGEEMLPGHDLTNGWGDLFSRGLEVVQSPGDHVSMLMGDAHLTTVARQIKAVLDRYDAVQNMETAWSDNETDAAVTAR